MNSTHRILYKTNNVNSKVAYWEAWLEDVTLFVTTASDLTEAPTCVNTKFRDESPTMSTTQLARIKLEQLTRSKISEGYVTELSEAYTDGLMDRPAPPAMRVAATHKFNPENIDWETAFIQPVLPSYKVIAHYGALHIQGGKELVAPHITRALAKAGLDKYVIEGGLYSHGLSIHEVNQIVWNGGDSFRQLDFYMNDLMQTLPFTQRIVELNTKYLEADCPPTLRLTPTVYVPSIEQLLKEQEALAMSGYRECVLYQGNSGYKSGKVSKSKVLLSGSWKSSIVSNA